MSARGKAQNQKIEIELTTGKVSVYASPRILEALQIVTEDMNIFKGVKLTQVLNAIYTQGKKDGAREVFDGLESSFGLLKGSIKHQNPGRPQASKKKAAKPSAKKAARKRPKP